MDGLPGQDPKAPGATEQEITDAERDLGIDFPADYRRFLLWSNGWEGFHGSAYIQLLSVSDVRTHNDELFRRAYPGVAAIGGDGGMEEFALHYRDGRFHGVVTFDPIAGLDSAIPLGETFTAAMARLAVEPSPWDAPGASAGASAGPT